MNFPTTLGWYIVIRRGVSSPGLIRWYGHWIHSSWSRVTKWQGPVDMDAFQLIETKEADATPDDSGPSAA